MATLTTNQNYLQPAGFRVIIDRENYPNLEYFAQSVNHPDVSVTGTVLPFRRIENVNMPGDTISFSELSISFILDENMKAYTELYEWMEYSINNEFVGQGPRSKIINPELPTKADNSVSIL